MSEYASKLIITFAIVAILFVLLIVIGIYLGLVWFGVSWVY